MYVIGVCACPSGIAHTYMAADSLERKAKKLGYKVKIETDGSGGVENALTEKDIQEADYVILATDISVPTERFRGKKVLIISVTDAIRKVDDVYNKLKNDEVSIY